MDATSTETPNARCPVCGQPAIVTRGADLYASVFLHGSFDEPSEEHGPIFDAALDWSWIRDLDVIV